MTTPPKIEIVERQSDDSHEHHGKHARKRKEGRSEGGNDSAQIDAEQKQRERQKVVTTTKNDLQEAAMDFGKTNADLAVNVPASYRHA